MFLLFRLGGIFQVPFAASFEGCISQSFASHNQRDELWLQQLQWTKPIGSMYGIFTYISHNQPNVGEYTTHASLGKHP